jgi:hypothetical protein
MNAVRSFMQRACLLTACALAVGLSAAVKAQTVLIDFGNNELQYRGIPVPDPDPKGHYWNSIQPGLLVEDMVDINNSPTTIDLGWNSPVGTDSYNGPAGDTSFTPLEDNLQFTDIDIEALGNLGVLEAAFDFAASPIQEDTRALFDLQGLDPAKTYSLTFFGSHKYSNDPTTVYSVFSDSTYTTLLGTASLDVMDPLAPEMHNRDLVATISNLSPPVDTGILYVQFVSATGNLGYLNSLQVEAIAAPGIAGDYNNDGSVDAADYVVWRKNEGTMNTLPNDPHGETIGAEQYNTWRTNFGMMTGGGGIGGGAPIPEPASLMLAVAVAIGWWSLNRSR